MCILLDFAQIVMLRIIEYCVPIISDMIIILLKERSTISSSAGKMKQMGRKLFLWKEPDGLENLQLQKSSQRMNTEVIS